MKFLKLFFVFWVVIVSLMACSTNGTKLPRGVSPEDSNRYSGTQYECGDGRKIPISLVNDDFCDCFDGSDEPGTSACSNGHFYCHNRLHRSEILPSSRVNDGICDCCDGSDEFSTPIKCPKTCRELGEATRVKEREMAKTLQQGLSLKATSALKAQEEFKKKRDEIENLKKRHQTEEDEANKLEERKKAVQEKENLKAEELKLKKEAEEKANPKPKEEEKPKEEQPEPEQPKMEPEPTMQEAKAAVGWENENEKENEEDLRPEPHLPHRPRRPHPPHSHHHPEMDEESRVEEENKEQEQPKVEEEKPKEPEDPELAAMKEEQKEDENSAIIDENPEQQQEEGIGEEEEAEEEENTEIKISFWKSVKIFFVGNKYLHKRSLPRRLLSPFIYTWRRFYELYSGKDYIDNDDNWEPPVINEKTRKAQNEVDVARNKARETQNEIDKIEKLLNSDFGKDNCFYSLYGSCIDIKKDEYTYEICPFDKATQKGDSHTSLGTWGKWSDDHKAMIFEGGLRCWNGPDRSARVELSCGLENKLLDASEPARCEYAMKMTSPCACTQEELTAIQEKLKQYEQFDKEDQN